MKIGEFAKKNNVSIDTVRHYMDLGLILPVKIQGQYSFDEQCEQNMTEVLILKEMGFKLNEIKTISMFKLLGNMTSYQKNEYYRMLFEKKYTSVLGEINELENFRKNLETKIKELSEHKEEKKYTLGVSLNAISKLRCLKCKERLMIKNGEIVENQIITGTLSCECGETYKIRSGIIMISEGIIEDSISYNHNFITNYISSTDSRYLENIYKGIDWGMKNIQVDTLNSKTILEVGSGVGFMLRNLYQLLPDDCLYIAVDHDINRHCFLKNMLERSEVKKELLFICTDFKKIPIANKSVDFLMDYSGTSNYSFEHTTFLLDEINRYIKDDAALIGSFILFKNFATNSLIEEKFKKNFKLACIKEKISALGYSCQNDSISDELEKGGLYEDYFVEGEIVYNYHFYGERLG